MSWLIYGATGYTGELVARLAVARGERPLLAGRREGPVRALASELGLEARAFGLEDERALDAGIEGARAVLHCAGPFSATARPMAEACLRRGVHYLDITGEASVFVMLAARDAAARRAGIALLPGAGFDVVPSDCLAAHLKRRLPSATSLTLAFASSGRLSRGTATTMVENLPRGGLVRRDGVLEPVPGAWKTRRIDFGRGQRLAMTIPWGDVVTAHHSTGIPNVEVYMAVSPALRLASRLSRPFGWLLGSRAVQGYLRRRIQAGPAGPSADERARGRCLLWGEARDAAGAVVASRLQTPEGYALTAETALDCVRRAAAGTLAPGFLTPSLAFGPDFILRFPGCERQDL